MAAVYLVALADLLLSADARFAKAALVPAVTFCLVTILRAIINSPRPYEVHGIVPIVHKTTSGKSLPSRHVSSAVVIACTLMWLFGAIGILAFAVCLLIACTRVIGGVHFPRDVISAFAISLACAAVGFVLIP